MVDMHKKQKEKERREEERLTKPLSFGAKKGNTSVRGLRMMESVRKE